MKRRVDAEKSGRGRPAVDSLGEEENRPMQVEEGEIGMIDEKTAQALFKAARACDEDIAAGIAQKVAVSRILEERDAYRDAALRAECGRRDTSCGCGHECPPSARYCAEVVDEVDGGVGGSAQAEIEDMLEEFGGWPPKRKRPAPKVASER